MGPPRVGDAGLDLTPVRRRRASPPEAGKSCGHPLSRSEEGNQRRGRQSDQREAVTPQVRSGLTVPVQDWIMRLSVLTRR